MLKVFAAAVALLALGSLEPAQARPHTGHDRSPARMHRKVVRHRHHGRLAGKYHRHHRHHARAHHRPGTRANVRTSIDWSTRYFATEGEANDFANEKRNEGASVSGPYEYMDGYLVMYSFAQ